MPPVLLAAIVMTGAATSLGLRALLFGGIDLRISTTGWFWLLCIAGVSTVLASVAFFAGLHRVGPSTAAILSTFEPVVTTTLAAIVLGELLSPVQLLGGCPVILVQAQGRRRTGAVLSGL